MLFRSREEKEERVRGRWGRETGERDRERDGEEERESWGGGELLQVGRQRDAVVRKKKTGREGGMNHQGEMSQRRVHSLK